MLKEFRDFIARGNVMELAIAVVIGVAFNDLVNSVVEGLITPLIGMLGSRDFSALDFTINDSTFEWGNVVNALLQFLSIAAAIFFIFVKPMNHLAARRRRGEEPQPESVSDEVALLTEIRDLMRYQAQTQQPQPRQQPPGSGRLYE